MGIVLFYMTIGGQDGRPLVTKINDIMAEENRKSYRAVTELNSIQPLIKAVLKVKCSPFTSRQQREPIEREIREKYVTDDDCDYSNDSDVSVIEKIRLKIYDFYHFYFHTPHE